MARRTTNPVLLGDFSEGVENNSLDSMNAVPPGPDETIEGLSPTMEMSDFDRVLFEVGEAADDAKINVYRVDSATRKEAYLFQCTPGEFTLDRILQNYGGGTFRVRGYQSRMEGRAPTLFVNRTVTLEEPKGGIAPSPERAAQDGMAKVLEQLAAMQAQTQQMIAAALTPKPEAANSRMQMLQEFQIMREIFAQPPAAPAAPAASPISQIKEMLELVSMLKGQEAAAADPTTGLLMTMLDKLGGPIAEAAMAQAKSGQGAPAQAALPAPGPVYAPLPLPVPAPATVANPATENSEGENMSILFQQAMKTLDTAAKKNVDAAEFAEKIADVADMNPKAGAFVADFIRRDDWLSMVREHIPTAEDQREWYGRLRAALADLYENDLPAPPAA